MTLTPEQIGVARDRIANGAAFSKSEMQQLVDAADKLARLTALLDDLRAFDTLAADAPWRVQGQGGIRMDGVRDSYVIQSGQAHVCKSPTRPGHDRNPEGERANFELMAAARNALAEMLRVVGS